MARIETETGPPLPREAIPVSGLPGDDDVAIGLAAVLASRGPVPATARPSAIDDAFGALQVMLDALPLLVCYVDRDLRYRFVNRTHGDWHGCRSAEVIGLRIKDVVGPVAYELVRPHFEAAFDGQQVGFDIDLNYPKAGRKLVHVTLVPHGDPNCPVAGVYLIGCDRSAERQSHEARRQSEVRLLAIMDSVAEGIVTVLEDGTIDSLNRTAIAIFESGTDEVVGRNIAEFLPDLLDGPGDGNPSIGLLQARRNGSVTWTRETRAHGVDGSIKDVEVTISGVPADDDRRYLCAIRDVSERKRAAEEKAMLEQRLSQAQKMEAIGALSGGIAHDFNNILTGVLGFADLIDLELPDDSPVRDDLREIVTAANRASKLVRQMLALSRHSEREHRPIDLGRIVQEALRLIRVSVPTTIEIRQDLYDGPAMIIGDPTQIHQVVLNLCANGSQAMDAGPGLLGVRTARFDLEAPDADRYPGLAPGSYVELVVSDSGHGMDPETLERAFDPFFTTKEPGKGTGLGLSAVHGIVSDHGGIIEVETAPDRGTTFRIYLPAAASLETANDPVDAAPRATGDAHVLFVDDEPAVCKVAKRSLERRGYRVTSETDPVRALEIFRADPSAFAVAVIDLVMPKTGGDVLARQLHALRPDLPIAVCSAMATADGVEKYAHLGARALIAKPFSPEKLCRAIAPLVEKDG